jgi:hypothetical protein
VCACLFNYLENNYSALDICKFIKSETVAKPELILQHFNNAEKMIDLRVDNSRTFFLR